MGYASYLVWREGGGFEGSNRLPLTMFGTQLVINWAYSPIFFGTRNLKWVCSAGFLLFQWNVCVLSSWWPIDVDNDSMVILSENICGYAYYICDCEFDVLTLVQHELGKSNVICNGD